MIQWIKRLLNSKPKPPEGCPHDGPAIAAGQRWIFMYDDGPWESPNYSPVTIVDVKDGWVRYAMTSSYFSDCRHRIKTFVRMYRRIS